MRSFMLSPESMDTINEVETPIHEDVEIPSYAKPLTVRELVKLYKKASHEDKVRVSAVLGAFDSKIPAADDEE